MKAPTPTIVLWVIAPGLMIYGLLSGLWPEFMAGHLQIELLTGSGRADYLATYAGVPMALALYLAYSVRRKWFRSGLICAGMVLTGFTAWRLTGVVTAGGALTLFSWGALGIEAVGAALAFWALAGMGRTQPAGGR